jgi:hypothetical protein
VLIGAELVLVDTTSGDCYRHGPAGDRMTHLVRSEPLDRLIQVRTVMQRVFKLTSKMLPKQTPNDPPKVIGAKRACK